MATMQISRGRNQTAMGSKSLNPPNLRRTSKQATALVGVTYPYLGVEQELHSLLSRLLSNRRRNRVLLHDLSQCYDKSVERDKNRENRKWEERFRI